MDDWEVPTTPDPAPQVADPELGAPIPTVPDSGISEWDLTGWLGYPGPGFEGDQSNAETASTRSKKRLLVGALAVVLVAVAISVGMVSVRNGPPMPGAGIAPAAFVVSSTQDTLAQRTANVTLSGIVSGNGRQVPLQGTGTANFDTNAFSATIDSAAGTGSLVERELVVDNHFYIGMTIDGHNMSEITGGAHWIDVPTPDQNSSSVGAGNVDPLQQIQTLESKGAKVVPLGSSEIDGDTVSGYAVTPSRAAEIQNVEKEIQSGAIPQSVASQAMKGAQALAGFTMNVYIDSNSLMRRMTMDFPGSGSGITGTVTMTFSNYGTPVSIAPPSSSDIVSFDQFVKDAQAAGASTS